MAIARIDDEEVCAWCGTSDASRAGVVGSVWRICGRCTDLALANAPVDPLVWEEREDANFKRSTTQPPAELLRIMRAMRMPDADLGVLLADLRHYTNRPEFEAYMRSLSCCFCRNPLSEGHCSGPGVQACVECVHLAQQALLDEVDVTDRMRHRRDE